MQPSFILRLDDHEQSRLRLVITMAPNTWWGLDEILVQPHQLFIQLCYVTGRKVDGSTPFRPRGNSPLQSWHSCSHLYSCRKWWQVFTLTKSWAEMITTCDLTDVKAFQRHVLYSKTTCHPKLCTMYTCSITQGCHCSSRRKSDNDKSINLYAPVMPHISCLGSL